jgi:hypothetical protein
MYASKKEGGRVHFPDLERDLGSPTSSWKFPSVELP